MIPTDTIPQSVLSINIIDSSSFIPVPHRVSQTSASFNVAEYMIASSSSPQTGILELSYSMIQTGSSSSSTSFSLSSLSSFLNSGFNKNEGFFENSQTLKEKVQGKQAAQSSIQITGNTLAALNTATSSTGMEALG